MPLAITDMKQSEPFHIPMSADQSFACLLFDAADEVRDAEILTAPKKAVPMQRAMSRMHTRDGVVGFQLWKDGLKVAEFFPERHRAASRMVSGPIIGPATRRKKN
jgi:hypothetical protein